jgi:hypothetical protein
MWHGIKRWLQKHHDQQLHFRELPRLALESVDGGAIEDITFKGIIMRDIRNALFFLRLAARLRAPAGTSVGTFKRVIIKCAHPILLLLRASWSAQ